MGMRRHRGRATFTVVADPRPNAVMDVNAPKIVGRSFISKLLQVCKNIRKERWSMGARAESPSLWSRDDANLCPLAYSRLVVVRLQAVLIGPYLGARLITASSRS